MAKYQGLIQSYLKYNDLLFQQRTLFLPTIASIQDDHAGQDTTAQIMPFPELTERERRLISDQNVLKKIKGAGDNLEEMIEKELE